MNKPVLNFTEDEVQQMLDNLDQYTTEEIAEIDRMVDELSTRKINQAAYDDLIEFCKAMQPDYIVGKHHRLLADMLMGIERGKKTVFVSIYPLDMVNHSLFLSCFPHGSWAETQIKRL